MQHHFVVMYDTETDNWEIDVDSQTTLFPSGNTYAPEDWLEYNGWSNKDVSLLTEDILAVYLDAINKGNFIIKER
jgi:hypothetical protein